MKPFSAINPDDTAGYGGKATTLALMHQHGIPVPDGYALHSDHSQGTPLDTALIQNTVSQLNTEWVAVRSSATLEDGVDNSFAGLFESYVVRPEQVIPAIESCHASADQERVQQYCALRGIEHTSIRVAVILQRMIPADACGVCFTADPVTGDTDTTIIEAAHGTAYSAQDDATPDRYIREGGTWTQTRGRQQEMLALADNGLTTTAPPDDRASITPEIADRVHRLAQDCEDLLDAPADIEWVLNEGKVQIVQARPITTI